MKAIYYTANTSDGKVYEGCRICSISSDKDINRKSVQLSAKHFYKQSSLDDGVFLIGITLNTIKDQGPIDVDKIELKDELR